MFHNYHNKRMFQKIDKHHHDNYSKITLNNNTYHFCKSCNHKFVNRIIDKPYTPINWERAFKSYVYSNNRLGT
jgi:hypothetical protein